MASVLLTAAGAAVGGGLPGIGLIAGPLLGYAGGMLGAQIDGAIGIIPQTNVSGPRLGTLRMQDSREGAAIPRVYGTMRLAGNVIWSSNLIETRNTQRIGGGKGGSARATTYRYAAHLAVGLCAGPVAAVHRIWADSKLIYDRALNTLYTDAVRIYTGNATQTPDALIESYVGTGNASAFRGTAYVVLENLKLEHYGNRIPNLTFEIEGFSAPYEPILLGQTTHACGVAASHANPRRAMVINSRQVVIPGVENSGTNCNFIVEHHEWNGNAFTLTHTLRSAHFTTGATVDNFCLAPGRDRIACSYSDALGANICIYDINARSFGAIVQPDLGSNTLMTEPNILWVDHATLVMPAVSTAQIGVVAMHTAGASIVAASPLPFTGFYDNTVLSKLLDGYMPAFTLGGLVLITTNAGAGKLGIVRLAASNNEIIAEIHDPVTPHITLGGGAARALLLPNAELMFVNDRGTAADIFIYAVTATGIDLTRGGPTTVTIGSGIMDFCVANADRVAIINDDISLGYMMSELQINDTGITVSAPATLMTDTPVPDNASLTYIARSGGNALMLLNDQQLLAVSGRRGDNSLAAIIDDMGTQLGLSPADLITADLSATRVAGFIVPEQQTVRSALETLQSAFPFVVTETDGTLIAKPLDGDITATIPTSARRAGADTATSPSLQRARQQGTELPTAVQVDYIDAGNDYQIATAMAQRSAPPHARLQRISLPVVLDAIAAQSIADSTLARSLVEQESAVFTVPRDWLALDVADRVICDDSSYRITHITQQNGLLKVSAVRDDIAVLGTVAALGGAVSFSFADTVPPNIYAFDLPALSAAADQPGIYIGATAPDGWLGGVVYRSLAGMAAAEHTRLSLGLVAGYATTTLGNGPADYTDATNTVTIALAFGTLSSAAMFDVLNGANLALLGNEILQFQAATLVAPNTYVLSNLLRGRYGTENEIASHAAAEHFTLLETDALQFVPTLLSDRGRGATLQLLNSGQTLAEALPVPYSYDMKSLQPFSPVGLTAMRDVATNDVTLSWIRRARVNFEWGDYIDVPLDEASENYMLDIMSGATVLRTFTPTTSTQAYSSAEQTADFGAPPATLTFRVAQVSARYGAGMQAIKTITL